MDNLSEELFQIGNLLKSAKLMSEIKKAARVAVGGKRVSVIDGSHAGHLSPDASKFDVIVSHKEGKKESLSIRRSVSSSVVGVEIEELVDGVIGIRTSRRVKDSKSTESIIAGWYTKKTNKIKNSTSSLKNGKVSVSVDAIVQTLDATSQNKAKQEFEDKLKKKLPRDFRGATIKSTVRKYIDGFKVSLTVEVDSDKEKSVKDSVEKSVREV